MRKRREYPELIYQFLYGHKWGHSDQLEWWQKSLVDVGLGPFEYNAVRSLTCISPWEGRPTGRSGRMCSSSTYLWRGLVFKSLQSSYLMEPNYASSLVHDEMRCASGSLKLTKAYKEIARALALVELGMWTSNVIRKNSWGGDEKVKN